GVCWSRSSLPPGCVPSLGGATGACGTASTPASPWPAPTSDPGARLGRRPGLAGPAGPLRPLALTVAKVQCAQGGGSRPHGAVCVCVGVLVLALLGSVAAAEPGHGGAVANQQPAARGRTRQGPAPEGAGPCPLLFNVWRCPALPHPLGCSTIGAGSRNDRVRNGTGCDTSALTTKQTFEHTTPPQWNQCALPCPHPQTNKQARGCSATVPGSVLPQ